MPSPALITSVDSAATNVTLLAEAANKTGRFVIVNTDANILYIKYGETASATDFTVALAEGDTLAEEGYFGIVDGIWASNGSGAAKITVF
jgi:hypothetical protein